MAVTEPDVFIASVLNQIDAFVFFIFFFFFFQAEDGIRDLYVTGVQTCALPICHDAAGDRRRRAWRARRRHPQRDRKSTRLNSSHVEISYAVFCLKKKRNNCCCCYEYSGVVKRILLSVCGLGVCLYIVALCKDMC